MKEKRSLLRVVRAEDGTARIDLTGKMNGRGAYLCHNPDCFRRAVKARALERAFGTAVPDEVAERIARELQQEHER